jgi:hypothetical protein
MFDGIVGLNSEYTVTNQSFDLDSLEFFKRFSGCGNFAITTEFLGQCIVIHFFLCYICCGSVLGLIFRSRGSAAPAWLRYLGLREIFFIAEVVIAVLGNRIGRWNYNVLVTIVRFYNGNSKRNIFAVNINNACVTIFDVSN